MIWKPDIEIVTDERHRYFLEQAYETAMKYSEDPFTQTGAVLVARLNDQYHLIAKGANHLPAEIRAAEPDVKARLLDRAWKNANIIHAEPAVITAAKDLGYDITGTTMYMPWVPCTPCGEHIKHAGIAELIGHEDMIMKTHEKWWESVSKGIEDLKRAGVKLYMYRGKIGNVKSLFNGEVWFP